MGLLLTDSSTALTDGPSIFIPVSHTKSHARIAFSGERIKVCRSTNSRSGRKQPHNPHSHPRNSHNRRHWKDTTKCPKNTQHSPPQTLFPRSLSSSLASLFMFSFPRFHLLHLLPANCSESFLSAWLGFYSVSLHTFLWAQLLCGPAFSFW